MTVIKRFTQLFKADVHALLDQLEEPEALLKQALREMQEEHNSLLRQAHNLEQLNTRNHMRKQELAGIIRETGRQLDLCFEADNTELAKSLIRRRLEHQRLIVLLDQQSARNDNELKRLKSLIEAQHHKLEVIRQKAAACVCFAEDCDKAGAFAAADSGECIIAGSAHRVSDQDVEIALLEELQRRAK